MAISQSKTEWIKGKGVVYNSGPKKGQKVTGKIDIVADTASGKKAGQTYKYTAGKAKTAKLVATNAGAGYKGGSKPQGSKPQGPKSQKDQAVTPTGPKDGTKKYKARVAAQRAAANKAGASTYGKNTAPAARSSASGTPLLAGSEIKRGLTTKSGKTSTAGLPRGTGKPQTFGTKYRKGEKRIVMGAVQEWNGRSWVPFKKK